MDPSICAQAQPAMTVRELHRALQACQRRLGTAAETEGDFDQVLALAHELNNQLTAEYLRAVADTSEETTRSLASVCKQCLHH